MPLLPVASGSDFFTETFPYADGALATVGSAKWVNPLYTGQASVQVVSGAIRASVNGTYTDAASVGNSYGDGDYLFQLATLPGTSGHRAFLHICAKRQSEGGVDSYAINYNQQSTPTAAINRFDDGTSTPILAAQSLTGFAAGHWLCLRKYGSDLSLYRSADGITWTQVGTTVQDATYTSGRIGIETNSATVSVDNVAGRTNFEAAAASGDLGRTTVMRSRRR